MGALLLCNLPVTAQDNPSPAPIANRPVAFGISAPLRDLAKLPPPPQWGLHLANPVHRVPKRPAGKAVDPVEQSAPGAPSNFSLGVNVVGVGNGFPGYSVDVAPPDTQMAAGDTQLIQWVNLSYAVFDKSGNALTPAIPGNVLWTNLGGACASANDGDIVVLFDRAAHRWLLTQPVFEGPPYYTCLAVSTSSDALGTYYLYQFPQGTLFPDYPKWGTWSNGYYQNSNLFNGNNFAGPKSCAYNRTKILAGDNTAEQICFTLTASEDTLQWADIDSPTQPPAGQDAFAIGSVGDVDNSHLSLYSMHPVFSNPSQSTITGSGNSQMITIPTFTPACGANDYSDACVPQKGVTDMVDSLGGFLMYRFAYWEDPPLISVKATPPKPLPSQHWYISQDVQASGGNVGVRWYEFTAPIKSVPVTSISLFQSGTFAPDSNYRWMASMTRDKVDDVLIGYSESSANMYPSIAITGRVSTDPLGTLENEIIVVSGTGSQVDTANRWGDYSGMRIDPVDNCTFWYTTEYYMVTTTFDWSTQIASAKFSNCN